MSSIPVGGLGGKPGGPSPGAGGSPAALQAAMNQMQPIAIGLANFLRDNKSLKSRKGLLNNANDVDFFRYKRLVRALTSDEYKTKQANPKNKLVPIKDEKQATELTKILIQCRFIIPVTKLHFNEIKTTNKKWKADRNKPTLVPSKTADLSPDSYFMWNYTKPSPFMLLYSILLIAGVFTIILFPLWPRKMKTGVWYLSMGLLGLLSLFFIIAIIRLIIYIITLLIGKPFWLYPNLFADVGVIESFYPLYEWEKPKQKKQKKQSNVELKPVD